MKTKDLQASEPQKRERTKYTMAEFWDSLYYECCDADDDYDGYMHIVSDIDGSEIKIKVSNIVHQAAQYQNK